MGWGLKNDIKLSDLPAPMRDAFKFAIEKLATMAIDEGTKSLLEALFGKLQTEEEQKDPHRRFCRRDPFPPGLEIPPEKEPTPLLQAKGSIKILEGKTIFENSGDTILNS